AVGQLDHLFKQPVRGVESRMHVPQRTGAAELRERKRAGGKSLGYITGIVDAQHEKRYAARIRPLQRRKPVTDLLETGIETLRQNVDVVAERLGGAMERLI